MVFTPDAKRLAKVEQLLDDTWIPTLPDGWRTAAVTFSDCAQKMDALGRVVLDDGTSVSVPVPKPVWSALGALTIFSGDENGALWLSVTLERERGDHGASAGSGPAAATSWRVIPNGERRVYWGVHPDAPFGPPQDGPAVPNDEEWRFEFTRGNRSGQPMPAWLAPQSPDAADDDAAGLAALAAAIAAPTSVAAALDDLADSSAWQRLAADLDERIRAELGEVADPRRAADLAGIGVHGAELQPEQLRRFEESVRGILLHEWLEHPVAEFQQLVREAGDSLVNRRALEQAEGADPARPMADAVADNSAGKLGMAVDARLTRVGHALMQQRFGVTPAR